MRVGPGDTIRNTYAYDLPASSAEPLDMTSLQFHGLSISPNAPAGDSIGLMAVPGQTLHYVIHVPASQPPGLYRYHSHSHGEADWQLSDGMSGALIVEGTAKLSPATAGLPERVIVLRNVLSAPNDASLARCAPRASAPSQARPFRLPRYQRRPPRSAKTPSTSRANTRPSTPQTPGRRS